MKALRLMLWVPMALLTGCSTTAGDAVRVEEDFGNSVRQMIGAQIYNPDAAKAAATEPPRGLDGVQGEAVLKVYRERVGDPDDVDKTLRIDVAP